MISLWLYMGSGLGVGRDRTEPGDQGEGDCNSRDEPRRGLDQDESSGGREKAGCWEFLWASANIPSLGTCCAPSLCGKSGYRDHEDQAWKQETNKCNYGVMGAAHHV